MSKKLLKREITDAVDFLLEDTSVLEQGDIRDIEIDLLKAYHDHPFTLYTGKRLEDMVDSIRENGILNPIIVLKKEDGAYEILSGHNRVNAARFANLKTVPCIVKENLTDKEAYTYVIETNLMQRSFSDLLPTEKALVLKVRYEKIASQGKRNDLQKEINNLEQGIIEKESKAEDKTDSRKTLGKEYNLSGASIARYLRLNELSKSWKQEVDNEKIGLIMAVELSYLPQEIQEYLYQKCEEFEMSLKPSDAKTLHLMNRQEDLNQEMVTTYLLNLKKPKMKEYQNIKLSQNIYQKFFQDKAKEEAEGIIEKALEIYFKEYVGQ
ncbi:chromosome partitioning protein ParB [Fusobacterium necrophorum]|uniref:ParB N-terminal domain-containing protein n=1 Tax=Fusobacterium necrophorum TaxID=859 RepID=UPI00088CDC9A|nr:ParB N-terminal domain-containing protein [Fusobacterium necrophorum]AYZ74193.1 chromosome partitioning protein ParB [Fusobacterium necrophorum]AZW09925.1 chromosome partitioning protein ParB [Fusobacterium necrophorum subsp. necrophorum]SDB02024.1 chromosome partitioning protein, ParB family [Fusobacterium necrophorum]SQD08662.1 Chromosome-partitioning protein parB [Fusobacterium necrophorum subsp. necrophorum]